MERDHTVQAVKTSLIRSGELGASRSFSLVLRGVELDENSTVLDAGIQEGDSLAIVRKAALEVVRKAEKGPPKAIRTRVRKRIVLAVAASLALVLVFSIAYQPMIQVMPTTSITSSGRTSVVTTSSLAVTSFEWTKDEQNPLSIPGYGSDPSVIFDETEYKMWYSGEAGISYVTSRDTHTWSTPVTVMEGIPGTLQEAVGGPHVIFDSGLYKMWYAGLVPNEGRARIFYAYSDDGVTWPLTNRRIDPVFQLGEGWDSWNISPFTVIKEGGEYRIWYSGWNREHLEQGIGLAWSSDGINWIREPTNPVITVSDPYDAFYVGCAMKEGDTYILFVNGQVGSTVEVLSTYSRDGVNWGPISLIMAPTEGAWDSLNVRASSMIRSDHGVVMFYGGYDGATAHIGIAYASSA